MHFEAKLTKIREWYSQVGIEIPPNTKISVFDPQNYRAAAGKRRQGIMAGYVLAGGKREEIEKMLDEQIETEIAEIERHNTSVCVDRNIFINRQDCEEADTLMIVHELFHVYEEVLMPRESPEDTGKLMYEAQNSKEKLAEIRVKDYLEKAVRDGAAEVASIELLKKFGNDSEKRFASNAENVLKQLCWYLDDTFCQIEDAADDHAQTFPFESLNELPVIHGARFVYFMNGLGKNNETLFETSKNFLESPPRKSSELACIHQLPLYCKFPDFDDDGLSSSLSPNLIEGSRI